MGPLLRPGLSVMIVLVTGMILQSRLDTLDFAALWRAVASVPPQSWIIAALLTGISFWAVGRYDAAVHRMLGTGLAPDQARKSGRAAIAISQAVGFGWISGAFIRWQWGRGQVSAGLAAKVTAMVGICFLCGSALWALLLLPLTPVSYGAWGPAAAIVLAAALVAASFKFGTAAAPGNIAAPQPARRTWGRLMPGRLRHTQHTGSPLARGLRAPSVLAMGRLMGLTAVDLAAAALAFWVLLPDPSVVSPGLVIVVYTVALCLALISNAPGGIGPFDMALLMFLPMVPQTDILATCIAFRLVYYALPAILAGAAVLLRLVRVPDQPGLCTVPMGCPAPNLTRARNAELRLGDAADKHFAACGAQTAWLCAPLSQSLIAMFDPIGPQTAATLDHLRQAASRMDALPAIYKCTASVAVLARQQGWAVKRIAQDAYITPARFDPNAPGCRQLRRKLRKAEGAGVRITAMTEVGGHTLALTYAAQIDALNQSWTKRQGGARGFSMSRPGEVDLTRQKVFLIWQGPDLIGYCSFHRTQAAWALDLMPQAENAPDGAMHLAVATALKAARAEGIARVSLTAVPCTTPRRSGHAARTWLMKRALGRLENPGLSQFKSCFAPSWTPLYLAAPTRLGLVLAGAEICAAITAPARPHGGCDMTAAHDVNEGYAFAS